MFTTFNEMSVLPGFYWSPKMLSYWMFAIAVCAGTAHGQSSLEIDSLNKALREEVSAQEKMMILAQLAEEWAALDFDSAIFRANQLKNLAESNEEPKFRILAFRMIGLAYDYSYEADSARLYYQLALEESYESNDTFNIAATYFNIGTLELFNGNYLKVLPWYEQAIDFFEKLPDSKYNLIKIYNNLGIVYRRINRHDEAILIYKRAMDLLDRQQDEKQLISIYINLGNALTSEEQYDSAAIYYGNVLDYANRAQDKLNYCYANNGLGMVAEANDEPERALYYFRKSLAENVEDIYVAFTTFRFMGSVFSELGQYDSANYYFERALPIYSEDKYPHQVKELYLQIALHNERLGNKDLALGYYKKYYSIKDELISQEVIDRTAEWEERFKAQEREKEIINLKLRNEEASLRAQQQTNQRNIFISISVFLGLVGGFSYYMYHLKKKVSSRLEEKNEIIKNALDDKELLMKEIHHRVKNNLQVISSLLNLQSNFIADEKANAAVLESKNRVHSMALVHQRLYQHDNITEIDLEEYLDQLIGNLEQSYSGSERQVTINLEADRILMDVDKVILLGLIVNELVTNAIKYAFESKAKNGMIDVAIRYEAPLITLSVADNGKGMERPPEVKKESLGTLLIRDLSKKLGAELRYDFSRGTRVILAFEYQKQFA